jgi:hypothetical protein
MYQRLGADIPSRPLSRIISASNPKVPNMAIILDIVGCVGSGGYHLVRTYRMIEHIRQCRYQSNSHRCWTPPLDLQVTALCELPACLFDRRVDGKCWEGHGCDTLEDGTLDSH